MLRRRAARGRRDAHETRRSARDGKLRHLDVPTAFVGKLTLLDAGELIVHRLRRWTDLTVAKLDGFTLVRHRPDRGDDDGGAGAKALVRVHDLIDGDVALFHGETSRGGEFADGLARDPGKNRALQRRRGDGFPLDAEKVARAHLLDVLVFLRVQVHDVGETSLLRF